MGSFLQGLFHSNYLSNIHWILIMGHVSLAVVAIVCGPIPMIARKGGKYHKLIGKVFLWSMVTSLLLAIVLLFFRFNVFLAGITALSLNGVVTGVRSLYRKRAEQNSYAWFDVGFAVAMLLAGVGLFSYGVLTALGVVALDGIASFAVCNFPCCGLRCRCGSR